MVGLQEWWDCVAWVGDLSLLSGTTKCKKYQVVMYESFRFIMHLTTFDDNNTQCGGSLGQLDFFVKWACKHSLSKAKIIKVLLFQKFSCSSDYVDLHFDPNDCMLRLLGIAWNWMRMVSPCMTTICMVYFVDFFFFLCNAFLFKLLLTKASLPCL